MTAWRRCGDGVVEAGEEACDDGNNNNDDQCQNDCTQTPSGSTQVAPPGRACKAILDAGASTGSKACWIDPNAGGTDDAFQTWCDMTPAAAAGPDGEDHQRGRQQLARPLSALG